MSVARWTPEARGALIERAAAGVSLVDSCRVLGLSLQTVTTWITRGRREDSGDYHDFIVALEAARASALARPEPLTPDEFRRYLDAAVRAGSVSAMKLWAELERQRSADSSAPEVPTGKIAELAAHRARRAQ